MKWEERFLYFFLEEEGIPCCLFPLVELSDVVLFTLSGTIPESKNSTPMCFRGNRRKRQRGRGLRCTHQEHTLHQSFFYMVTATPTHHSNFFFLIAAHTHTHVTSFGAGIHRSKKKKWGGRRALPLPTREPSKKKSLKKKTDKG